MLHRVFALVRIHLMGGSGPQSCGAFRPPGGRPPPPRLAIARFAGMIRAILRAPDRNTHCCTLAEKPATCKASGPMTMTVFRGNGTWENSLNPSSAFVPSVTVNIEGSSPRVNAFGIGGLPVMPVSPGAESCWSAACAAEPEHMIGS